MKHTRAELFLRLSKAPLRTARTPHVCCICTNSINPGDRYRDGRDLGRAHDACVENAIGKAKP
jgi:hypothetical protein